jgi:Na+/melibiose symporter-like transporter
MQHEFLLLMGLALALGFKHSYDADHLVAVSNLIARSDNLKRTSLMSTSWAIGHMTTATVITILMFTFRELFLDEVIANLEFIVAVMLVVIGVVGLLWEYNILHVHEHWHDFVKHRHLHTHVGEHGEHGAMFSIGIVHGIASNDEIFILFVVALGVTSLGGVLLGVAVFSVGVVAGMILFGLGLNFPILKWGRMPVRRAVNVTAAVLSIAYAVLLFSGFEGFNPIPSPA